MALELVDESARASAILNPMRMRILDALREPGSATTVAKELGLARQKVNYHLRELEKAGFLEEIEQRRSGNCIERIVRAKATHYLIHPEVLGRLATDPNAIADRFSSTYLIALAAEAIRDVAAAQEKATRARKKLATFSLQTDVRFATAEDRRAFTEALANAVAKLVARYHDDETEGGRAYRFLIGAYPARRKEK
ncbi:MAG TPA: helix-turn-helix domain-containing protein [Thermoanaerobaculia bacterium]|nr:helix-turn-helix domain-containing protein [Thermoanaerobaculia bacterium]